ncbi:MAG: hypothetical protein M1834_000017 [Cirrosporium novae-zelandiae]|nr:MAG: hypothetical protein M1834_000017 [Cirrosporium novae-zelandiae]
MTWDINTATQEWLIEHCKRVEAKRGRLFDQLGGGYVLLRLSNLIRNLLGTASDIVLFWLDTICVPPDKAHQNQAQTMALEMMRQTYEDATAVLVLDSWLLDCKTGPKSDIEILTRIFNCLWNRRLWTYQEGALAKKLIFQFEDCAFKNSGRQFIEKIDGIIGAMKSRATSVAADEAFCLTALLGFDMKRIVNADGASRMEEFWRMTPLVPKSIILYEGDTFNTAGLGWAPRTLLQSQSNIDSSKKSSGGVKTSWKREDSPAKVTPEGLLVQQAGVIFNVGISPIGTAFLMKDETRQFYQFTAMWAKCPHTETFMEDNNGILGEALSCSLESVGYVESVELCTAPCSI